MVAVSSGVYISAVVSTASAIQVVYAAVVGGRFLGKGENVVFYVVYYIYIE